RGGRPRTHRFASHPYGWFASVGDDRRSHQLPGTKCRGLEFWTAGILGYKSGKVKSNSAIVTTTTRGQVLFQLAHGHRRPDGIRDPLLPAAFDCRRGSFKHEPAA